MVSISNSFVSSNEYNFLSDHEELMSELETMFHDSDRAVVEEQIVTELDPMAKGYVETEDL